MKIGKLGRLRPVTLDRRRMRLARYLTPALPPPPEKCDWTVKSPPPRPMGGNDTEGDCVVVDMGQNAVMTFTANGKGLYTPDLPTLNRAYSAVTGYDPSQTDPTGYNPTDQGTDPVAFAKYMVSTGIGPDAAGQMHKFGAYVIIDPSRPEEIRQSIALFLNANFALNLPDVFRDLNEWVIPPGQKLVGEWAPNPNNGHMVYAGKYDKDGAKIITWEQEVPMSDPFAAAYGDPDQSIVVLSPDIVRADGTTPVGVDMATLLKDLSYVRGL